MTFGHRGLKIRGQKMGRGRGSRKTEHRTSNQPSLKLRRAVRPTSNIERHGAEVGGAERLNIERRTSNFEHRTTWG